MNKKKVVIALGGNALGNNYQEEQVAMAKSAKVVVDLIEEGFQVVLTHGNGPQVGAIHTAMTKDAELPLSVSVAMSQGSIGYGLQRALRTELRKRNVDREVSTVITQVKVDQNDHAFSEPTKPIGRFFSEEEAKAFEKENIPCVEDSGRGYRTVVASPKPVGIVEINTIQSLVEKGDLVIACGGGGIPVVEQAHVFDGVEAVIDKDFASALLAKELDADYLIILTAVEKVAINFGKENQKWLSSISVVEAKEYINQGHFAPGSMLPKIEAAIDFVEGGSDKNALITLLEKAKEGVLGQTGTVIQS